MITREWFGRILVFHQAQIKLGFSVYVPLYGERLVVNLKLEMAAGFPFSFLFLIEKERGRQRTER